MFFFSHTFSGSSFSVEREEFLIKESERKRKNTVSFQEAMASEYLHHSSNSSLQQHSKRRIGGNVPYHQNSSNPGLEIINIKSQKNGGVMLHYENENIGGDFIIFEDDEDIIDDEEIEPNAPEFSPPVLEYDLKKKEEERDRYYNGNHVLVGRGIVCIFFGGGLGGGEKVLPNDFHEFLARRRQIFFWNIGKNTECKPPPPPQWNFLSPPPKLTHKKKQNCSSTSQKQYTLGRGGGET